MNNYEILGLNQAALAEHDDKTLKKIINSAYLNKVKEIHPDVSGKVETEAERVATTIQLVRLKDARDALVADPLAIDDQVLRGGHYQSTHGETFTSVLDDEIQEFLQGVPQQFRGELAEVFGQMALDAETSQTAKFIYGDFLNEMRDLNERRQDAAHIKEVSARNAKEYRANLSDAARARIALLRASVTHRRPDRTVNGETAVVFKNEKELIARMKNRDFDAIAQLVDQTDFNTRHGMRMLRPITFAGINYAFIEAMTVLPPEKTSKWGLREKPRAEDFPLYALVRKTDPNSSSGVKVLKEIISFDFANPEHVKLPTYFPYRELGEKVRAEIIAKTDFDTANGVVIAQALVDSKSLRSGNTGLEAVKAIVSKCTNPGRIQHHAVLSLLGEAGLIDQRGQVISPRSQNGPEAAPKMHTLAG